MMYVRVAVVDLREEPSSLSKVGSQALLGERVEVGEQRGEWTEVQTADGYKGWVPRGTLFQRERAYPGSSFVEVSRLAAHLFNVKDTEYGPIQTVSFGTKLQKVDNTDPRWIEVLLPDERVAYIQKGDVIAVPQVRKKEELIGLSQQFLGLPYTWGGKSSFGFDCSGFVQMLYARLGIALPRNACDQMRDPRFQTVPLEMLCPGDLIFFRKSDRQMHVGLVREEGTFIHATSRENQPFIRVSRLSDREWSGGEDVHYPERVGRKLLCQSPEEDERGGDFCSDR